MASKEIIDLEQRCAKTVEHLKTELTHVRTGRASTGILEEIKVDYYGSSCHLNQLGLIQTPEPRLITIQVYDKAAVDAIEKAILASDLGLNPSRDGNIVRLTIPALTEERRRDLVKTLHKTGEENKVVLRNCRRDTIDSLKKAEKNKAITEDDLHKLQEEVQKVTDKYIAEIEKLLLVKEKEIMEV